MSVILSPIVRDHAFLDQLLAWLNSRFAPDGPEILDSTPLFADGLLDSLRILELIAWTERAIGREIADAQIRTDYFATASRMARVFGGEEDHDQR